MNITPEIGQRAALVGRTGSGKTTTAIALLEAVLHEYPVCVLDTKGVRAFEQLPGYIFTSPSECLDSLDSYRDRPGDSRFTRIYRPERLDSEPRALDGFLDEIYELKLSLYLYIDETYQIVEGTTRPARGLANLIMRGRYREVYGNPNPVEVTVICGTQRPSWVPKIIFTEADHFYMHALSNRDDLHLMATYTDPVIEMEPAQGHEFWYYDIADQQARLCHVNLEEQAA